MRTKTVHLILRLSQEAKAKLAKLAAQRGKTLTDLVIDGLEKGLRRSLR